MLGRDQRLLNLLDRATDGGFTYLIGQTDMKRCPVFAPVHQREQQLICPAQFGRAAKRAQSFFHNGQHLLEGLALNSSCPFEVLMTKVLYHFISHLSIIMLIYDLCKRSSKKDFSIAVVTFDTNAAVHTSITRVHDDQGNTIDDNADYNPLNGHGGGTDIGEGLKVAHSLAEQFLSSAPTNSVPHSVVVVVMSDGMSNGDPVAIANRMKHNPKITICSTLFARKGENDQESQQAQALLKEIASSPVHYKTVYDAETLRKFFVASVSSGKNVNIR